MCSHGPRPLAHAARGPLVVRGALCSRRSGRPRFRLPPLRRLAGRAARALPRPPSTRGLAGCDRLRAFPARRRSAANRAVGLLGRLRQCPQARGERAGSHRGRAGGCAVRRRAASRALHAAAADSLDRAACTGRRSGPPHDGRCDGATRRTRRNDVRRRKRWIRRRGRSRLVVAQRDLPGSPAGHAIDPAGPLRATAHSCGSGSASATSRLRARLSSNSQNGRRAVNCIAMTGITSELSPATARPSWQPIRSLSWLDRVLHQ
jgi:hypothetical protein